jgi:LPS-assembly lipoprotein
LCIGLSPSLRWDDEYLRFREIPIKSLMVAKWRETCRSRARLQDRIPRYKWPGARAYAAIASVSLLAACGFQLRGDVVIPFRDIYIAAPANSPVAADLTRKLQATNTKLAASAGVADGRLAIVDEFRDKIILSLSAAGRVIEYQLRLRVAYQLTDTKGAVLIERSEVNLLRNMSYDDAFVLAKAQEEALLFKDMQNDVVQQILRRLSRVKRAG